MSLVKSRPAIQRYYQFLLRLSLHGMNIGDGAEYNESGEKWVLEYIKNKIGNRLGGVIFDVGANKGDYAKLCRKIINQSNIYSFEPSLKTFNALEKNTDSAQNIKVVNIGFGEKSGTQTLFSNEKDSGLSSLYDRNLQHRPRVGGLEIKESVKIDTVDNYCVANKIDRIGLLKLDVEGNEFLCLRGAKKMIDGGKIDFIQFEFGGCNIDSKTYFRDFFYFLSPTHKIYRVLEKGLFEIDRYNESNEIFLTTNYLAERK